MLTVPFADFLHEARVFTRTSDRTTFSEAAMVRLLRRSDFSVLRRARTLLAREWSTFSENHGVDPLGPHSRIELHIAKANLLTGQWDMCVFWEPEHEEWAGMHLHFECYFVWPFILSTVF